MKKSEVTLGKVYAVKVSGKIVPVRLDSESTCGGWNGTNLNTKREVRIRSAAKLRREYADVQPEQVRKELDVLIRSLGE